MAFRKNRNGQYQIEGPLVVWQEELREAFEESTRTIMGDKETQWSAFLSLTCLSMATKAKIKWEKGWLKKRKAREVESLLEGFKKNAIPNIQVFDFLAENIPLHEMRTMKNIVVPNVVGIMQANARNFLPPDQMVAAPATNAPKLVKISEQVFHYPNGRYPHRWWGSFTNAIGMHFTVSEEPTEFVASMFLSYSHADKEFAISLAKDLRLARIKVWIDEAEIRGGDVFLARIESAIAETECLGIVLSPHSLNSEWVERELDLARRLQKTDDKIRILPILYQPCDWSKLFSDLDYVDFTDPKAYRWSCERIFNSLLDIPPPAFYTAKEAARLIKNTYRPLGDLCGLSQQGICQLVEFEQIQIRNDRFYADAKSGKSTIWVLEYFDDTRQNLCTYTVTDGVVDTLNDGRLETEIRTIDFNFVDSEVAVSAAMEYVRARTILPADDNQYFIETLLKYCQPIDGYLWFILFFDLTLADVTYVVEVNPHSGNVTNSYSPSEIR